METCNAIGCFKPRHKSVGGYEYNYCYDHWLAQMEGYKWENHPEGKVEALKTDTCIVEGCDQPRMRNGHGELLTMCDEHQRAKWREYASKQYSKKKKVNKPPRPRATQPPIGEVVEVLPPKPNGESEILMAVHPVKHDCDHCTAKATIEALRAKSPKLAKLIDAMQAEVEAAQELGL